jgi:hypothetical protein
MAEYVRYRVTAAKLGVTMALLGLIGGLAERAQGKQSRPDAKQAAAVDYFLKLDGLSGEERNVFLKLEYKLSKVLAGLDHKLSASFYTKQQADLRFLKIRDAAAEYLKIDVANHKFLKIDASNQFLKVSDADQKYLKLTDAAQYLKIDAANQRFVQGKGSVISGGATLVAGDGSVRPVLQTADGKFVITISGNADGVNVIVDNTSGALLPAVQTADGLAPKSADLGPSKTIQLRDVTMPHQLHLQVFGNDRLHQAMTLTLSTEPSSTTQGQTQVVAQLLIGLL